MCGSTAKSRPRSRSLSSLSSCFDPRPRQALEVPPAEVLAAASNGQLGLDHRFLHALLDRSDEAFSGGPRVLPPQSRRKTRSTFPPTSSCSSGTGNGRKASSFILKYIEEDPTDVPDEAIEALVAIGAPALEPLLKLYGELEEENSGEIAFILANLGVKDPRILQLLLDRIEFDLSDTVLLLVSYGDPDARSTSKHQAAKLAEDDAQLKKEIEEAIRSLGELRPQQTQMPAAEPRIRTSGLCTPRKLIFR